MRSCKVFKIGGGGGLNIKQIIIDYLKCLFLKSYNTRALTFLISLLLPSTELAIQEYREEETLITGMCGPVELPFKPTSIV